MFSLKLFRAEGDLADGAVDDVGLVQTVLHLTGFDFLSRQRPHWGHSASLGRASDPWGPNLTQTAHDAHHVGREATTTSKSNQFSLVMRSTRSMPPT